jgi:SAM-dependent methyltransferase
VLDAVRERYDNHYAGLSKAHSVKEAAALAVGGEFVAVGTLEYYALKAHGLSPDSVVVDVGCGTGRLAYQLARRGHRDFAGFDIAAGAVDYARNLCKQADWIFGVTDGLRIPMPDKAADFVCFFSLFTHVSHEHTYLYLKEAERVLRRHGIVIFTFLEFSVASHWSPFETAVKNFGSDYPPTVFMDRHAVGKFAHHLNYDVVNIVNGDVPTFPIEEEIVCGDGTRMKDKGFLGQSIAILRKRAA